MKKLIICLGPYIALITLLAVCVATCESFRNPQNYMVIGRQAAYTGIIALGMTMVIASGGIDLSVGSLFALSGVVALQIMPMVGGNQLWQFIVALIVAVGVGVAGGAVNGALVGMWRIPPFIATLGTMSIFRSVGLYLADAGRVSTNNECLAAFVNGGSTVAMLFLLAVIFSVMLNRTPFGRNICAAGSNEKVARYAGIRTNRVKFATYALTGALCGISAFLWAGRLGGMSSANDGMGYELDAIAAVIVGGTGMSGGKASIWGTIAGVFILVIISNALVPWGVSPKLQDTVKGLVIIIAVLFQYKKRNM